MRRVGDRCGRATPSVWYGRARQGAPETDLLRNSAASTPSTEGGSCS
jgi:hypothetical protein